jgi:hypothetical protein
VGRIIERDAKKGIKSKEGEERSDMKWNSLAALRKKKRFPALMVAECGLRVNSKKKEKRGAKSQEFHLSSSSTGIYA